MTCEAVPVPGGTAFICSRGARQAACDGLGREARQDRNRWRCPGCGRLVRVYESADGRTIAYQHLPALANPDATPV